MKKKSSTPTTVRDTDLWLTKSKSGGRSKVTTRCVSDNNQYYKDNIINSNRTTTRSWPVICRQPKPYDEDDYETVFALNNQHHYLHHQHPNSSSNEDLSTCQKILGTDSQRTLTDSHHDQLTESNKMQPRSTSTTGLIGFSSCSSPPPVVFLMITLVMTISATAMLCAAVMTDHWEIIRWDRDAVHTRITNSTSNRLHWFLDGRVAKISE